MLLLNETSPITFGLWLLGIAAFWLYLGLLGLLWQRRSRGQRLSGLLLALAIALLGVFCYEDLTWWSAALIFAPALLGFGSRLLRPISARDKL